MAATTSDVERGESEALAASAAQARNADQGLAAGIGVAPPAHDVGTD